MAETKTQKIARLNDEFRQSGIGGIVYMTIGIQALGQESIKEIYKTVQTYDDFTNDNDPYHEHDCGSFRYGREKILWKIDYYDTARKYGSEDPSDESKTCRVLTIMLTSEY